MTEGGTEGWRKVDINVRERGNTQKLGGALAGAIMGWLLASLGYLANQVQTESSELGIVLLMTVIPGVFALLAVFIIKYYPLNDHELNKIQTELTSRPSQIGNAKVE